MFLHRYNVIMEYIATDIPGIYIIEPKVFGDARGYFFESFRLDELRAHIGDFQFVQDNQSLSRYGVLRGFHFQRPPYSQAKLMQVLSGSVLDVAVDIRKGSPTFGKYIAVELSSENKKQLFVSKGFAHAFLVLSETAVFFYKCDEYYHLESESGIRFDDPNLGIDWKIPTKDIQLSEKDKQLKMLTEIDIPFEYTQ